MHKVMLGPGESHIGISIEKLAGLKDRAGVWKAKIYLSISNISSHNVRIININAEKHCAITDNSHALTVGLRDGVDLTIADSFIESGKYYDIEPTQQQSLVGTLDILRWIRIPANITEGYCTLIFTIAIDYYGIYNQRRCLFKVTAPHIFYFHFDKSTTPTEGELAHFDEEATKALLARNKGKQSALTIIHQMTSILNAIRNSAYVISESDELHEKSEKARRNINLGIIAKMRASTDREKRAVINILFLAAEPTDTAALRLGEELREIQEKLQLSLYRSRFKLEQRMSVRPTDMSQALLDVRPRIVHFSGHGTASGGLCFESQLGNSHLIEPDAIASLFEQFADRVSCVLLNACYSEIQANAIAKHIDYVIGMKDEIGDKAAIAFAVGFYQALGAGRAIQDAYKLGCVQIRLAGIPEHLTPILVKKSRVS